MATFTIETPFPTDLAPFKVIRRNEETGKGKIVDSAQTIEQAYRLLSAHAAREMRHAVTEHIRENRMRAAQRGPR